MTATLWTVHVDDNFHYMDEDERYVHGTFDSYQAAAAACMKIVDDFLASATAQTADALYESYSHFGEDPWIAAPPGTPDVVRFSAHDYARQRCHEIWP